MGRHLYCTEKEPVNELKVREYSQPISAIDAEGNVDFVSDLCWQTEFIHSNDNLVSV